MASGISPNFYQTNPAYPPTQAYIPPSPIMMNNPNQPIGFPPQSPNIANNNPSIMYVPYPTMNNSSGQGPLIPPNMPSNINNAPQGINYGYVPQQIVAYNQPPPQQNQNGYPQESASNNIQPIVNNLIDHDKDNIAQATDQVDKDVHRIQTM